MCDNLLILIFFLVYFPMLKCLTSLPPYTFSTTPTWYEYPFSTTLIGTQNEKLALIELITLRNKSPLKLKKLKLQWRGERIDNIYASLYQKKEYKNHLIPIEENLICDGIWNSKAQQIIFEINKKIVSLNKFYLVLRFPYKLEAKLKKGNFIPSNSIFKIS